MSGCQTLSSSITKESEGDYWALIMGSLAQTGSSHTSNIDHTAWKSVEEEGKGQGGSSLLKLKIIECTFHSISAIGNSVSDSDVCHCKTFFFVTEMLLYQIYK